MHPKATLYLDESGKSSLAEKEDEPFIIAGVILDDSEVSAVEGYFSYIKLKFEIPLDEPFHSYHIFENTQTKLVDRQLTSLSENLAEYISLVPITINITVISKSEFKSALGISSLEDFKGHKKRKEMKDFPYRLMAAYHFGIFGKYLEDKNYIGQVLADSRRGGDSQLLKTLGLCKEMRVKFNQGYAETVRNRIQAISFAEKNFLSGGLEITDLISYVSFFRARRVLSKHKEIGITKIWKSIRQKAEFRRFSQTDVRKFFDIKKDGVHKNLK